MGQINGVCVRVCARARECVRECVLGSRVALSMLTDHGSIVLGSPANHMSGSVECHPCNTSLVEIIKEINSSTDFVKHFNNLEMHLKGITIILLH